MKHIELQLILLAAMGMLIHICTKILEKKKKTPNFSFKYFFTDKMNYVRIVLTLASTLALMIMSDEISRVFGFTLDDNTTLKQITFFMIGYCGHSLIRNVLKIFKKRIASAD